MLVLLWSPRSHGLCGLLARNVHTRAHLLLGWLVVVRGNPRVRYPSTQGAEADAEGGSGEARPPVLGAHGPATPKGPVPPLAVRATPRRAVPSPAAAGPWDVRLPLRHSAYGSHGQRGNIG